MSSIVAFKHLKTCLAHHLVVVLSYTCALRVLMLMNSHSCRLVQIYVLRSTESGKKEQYVTGFEITLAGP